MKLHYLPLKTQKDVDEALETAEMVPVAIYKHSPTCNISAMTKERIDTQMHENRGMMPVYMVDVIEDKELSNYIAEKLDVRHESPQLITLKEGKPDEVLNHLSIRADVLSI